MGASRTRDSHARKMRICRSFALLAQLVEHFHGKEGVDGSSPSEGFGRRAWKQALFIARDAAARRRCRPSWKRYGSAAVLPAQRRPHIGVKRERLRRHGRWTV